MLVVSIARQFRRRCVQSLLGRFLLGCEVRIVMGRGRLLYLPRDPAMEEGGLPRFTGIFYERMTWRFGRSPRCASAWRIGAFLFCDRGMAHEHPRMRQLRPRWFLVDGRFANDSLLGHLFSDVYSYTLWKMRNSRRRDCGVSRFAWLRRPFSMMGEGATRTSIAT